MVEVVSIVEEVFSACRNDNVFGAIQGAVRLARLQRDRIAFAYFLFELGLPHGEASSRFKYEFKDLSETEKSHALETAFAGFLKAHDIPQDLRESLSSNKEHTLYYTGASTIDEELREARMLLDEMKSDPTFTDWKLRLQLRSKVSVVSRTRSLMLTNAFEYASRVESAIHAASTAGVMESGLWADLIPFVRNLSHEAESQLIKTLELFSSPEDEQRTHALTSMRRLFSSLADCLIPPDGTPGLQQDKYINRLSKFLEDNLKRDPVACLSHQALESDLRALYDRASKAVHSTVSFFEARQSILVLHVFLSALEHICNRRNT